MTATEYAQRTTGLAVAEAFHGGAMRGGYTDGVTFFYTGRGARNAVPVAQIADLKILKA